METEILQRLYDSEINFEIISFFDNGFLCKLGDEFNGYAKAWRPVKIKHALNLLADEAAKNYPESEFAKWWTDYEKNKRGEEYNRQLQEKWPYST